MITAATNIIVEAFALSVTLLLFLCSCLDRTPKTRMRFLLHAMLICNVGLLAACISTWALEGNARYTGLNALLTAFANGMGFPMAGFYTEYVSCSIGTHTSQPRKFADIVKGVCVLAFALNFVSIFNGMYFTCPNGVYTRGPLFLLNQLFAAFILIPDSMMIYRYRHVLEYSETVALFSFPMLPLLVSLTQFAFFGLTTMCLATTLTMIMIYVSAYLQRGWKLIRQEKELTESRISVMLSQIQPHFLYNALTAIARLCDIDPAKAKKTTVDFSDYLRGNLDSLSHKQPVLFSTELKHTQIYADIEKIRFGEKLAVEYDIHTDNFLIPSLTVQPLLENAVKYGVGCKKEGGTVRLTTYEKPEGWYVSVCDDGVGYDTNAVLNDGRTHIGIDNVRRRLELQAGGTLKIHSEPGVGTTAEIFIPKERNAT